MGKFHASRHLGPGDKVFDVSVSTKFFFEYSSLQRFT